eukprot:gene6944-8324_t
MHPLAVALAVACLPLIGMAPLEPELRNAAVLMAAMPMMSIYPILALPYGFGDRAAAALVLATVGSFATLNALLWLMEPIGADAVVRGLCLHQAIAVVNVASRCTQVLRRLIQRAADLRCRAAWEVAPHQRRHGGHAHEAGVRKSRYQCAEGGVVPA